MFGAISLHATIHFIVSPRLTLARAGAGGDDGTRGAGLGWFPEHMTQKYARRSCSCTVASEGHPEKSCTACNRAAQCRVARLVQLLIFSTRAKLFV